MSKKQYLSSVIQKMIQSGQYITSEQKLNFDGMAEDILLALESYDPTKELL